MGPWQGDPAWSGGTQTEYFEILQNRVSHANFQKTKIPIDPQRFVRGTSRILCRCSIRCATGTKEIRPKNLPLFKVV